MAKNENKVGAAKKDTPRAVTDNTRPVIQQGEDSPKKQGDPVKGKKK
jgi:hypothetical protein